jgi:hypothetical protein
MYLFFGFSPARPVPEIILNKFSSGTENASIEFGFLDFKFRLKNSLMDISRMFGSSEI